MSRNDPVWQPLLQILGNTWSPHVDCNMSRGLGTAWNRSPVPQNANLAKPLNKEKKSRTRHYSSFNALTNGRAKTFRVCTPWPTRASAGISELASWVFATNTNAVCISQPPRWQIGLSINLLQRELLGKIQHHIRFFCAGPVQELRTVDCPLSLLGGKLNLIVIRACHVSLFDFQRLEHVCLQTAIRRHSAGACFVLNVLGPQFLGQRRAQAYQALPLLEFCGPIHLLMNFWVCRHAHLLGPIKRSAIQRCCHPQRNHISCTLGNAVHQLYSFKLM